MRHQPNRESDEGRSPKPSPSITAPLQSKELYFMPKLYEYLGLVIFLKNYQSKLATSSLTKKIVDFKEFLVKTKLPDLKKYSKQQNLKKFKTISGNLVWGDYEMVFAFVTDKKVYFKSRNDDVVLPDVDPHSMRTADDEVMGDSLRDNKNFFRYSYEGQSMQMVKD